MRHAELRREAAAVIAAKQASALLFDSAVWYLVYGCVGVWVCVWWDERRDRFKNTFSADFLDLQIQSKYPVETTFSTGSASQIA